MGSARADVAFVIEHNGLLAGTLHGAADPLALLVLHKISDTRVTGLCHARARLIFGKGIRALCRCRGGGRRGVLDRWIVRGLLSTCDATQCRDLSVEGRINTLMDIIPQLNIEFDKLTHESQKLYEEVVKKAATEA